MQKIIIGTRGSNLSLLQTNIVKKNLLAVYPNIAIEIKVIVTLGDKNQKPIPLDSIGKGFFTDDIDKQLQKETIDLAVHSLKDLSDQLPASLIIAAIPKREDPREVLISKNGLSFEALPKKAVIGTDSIRRKAQLLNKRPDLTVKSIRGNVDTRLAKLETQDYDALVLAAAGLKRLGLEQKITQYFSISDFMPSPGQGALCLVIKKTNKSLAKLLEKINHKKTMIETMAERQFALLCGAGCKMPTAAYGRILGKTLTLMGLIASGDGQHVAKDSIKADVYSAKLMAKHLAKKLLRENKGWYQKELERYA